MALGCKPSVLRDYGGSNPPLSTKISESGSNSVGRVIAFQAIGRGFESRLPLQYPAHVAQSAERVLGKDEVTSSTLVVGSSEYEVLNGFIGRWKEIIFYYWIEG